MDFEIELLLTAILLGFPGAYVVKCLLLVRKDSHEGPFKSKNIFILFPEETYVDQEDNTVIVPEHIQRASLFDYVRRIFGVYTLSPDSNAAQTIWEIHPERSERFTCPFCLSFWAALLLSVPSLLIVQYPLWFFIAVHLTIATSSVIIYGLIDYVLR